MDLDPAVGESNLSAEARSGSLDALRVFALIAVVIGHIWPEDTRLSIYTWHVPLFFFLTGYLWTKGRTLRSEWSKRFRTLLLPLLSWGAVLLFLALGHMLYQRGFDLGLMTADIAAGDFHNGPFMAFWFVEVLFFTTIAFRALEKLGSPGLWIAAGVGTVLTLFAGPALAHTPLYVGLTLPCLVFVLSGYAFQRVRASVSIRTAVGLILLSGALIFSGITDYLDIKPGSFGTPVLSLVVAILLSAALIVVFERFRLSPKMAGAATSLATVGLAVVLGHATILAFTRNLDPWLTVIACLVVPWAAGLFAVQTPLARFVTGANQRPGSHAVRA